MTYQTPPWPPEMDADATRFGQQLMALYAATHGTHVGTPVTDSGGPVDILGWMRWGSDYRAYRANGLTHDDAYDRIEDDILTIWGVEPEEPEPPPVTGTGLVGRLRISGGCFVDDTGPVLPVFAHAGDLFSMYVRDRAFALQQLDDLVAAGYHGARVWFALGCGRETCAPNAYWAGREVGPTITPNYWDAVGQFLIAMHERGLKVVWSQGDPPQTGATMSERKDYARQCANVAKQVDGTGYVVAFFDAGNEAWQNDSDGLYRDVSAMADFVRAYTDAGGTGLTSTTSPSEEIAAAMDEHTPSGVSLWDVHSYRGGHWYDKRRHIFSLPYEDGGPVSSPVGLGSEPPGNGLCVSASSHKEELNEEAMGLLAAASLTCRTAHVWFSGEGVKLGAESPEGLKAMAGFYTVPLIQRALPCDVMTYGTLHHSGSTWSNIRVLAPCDDVTRVDGAISNSGYFVYTIDGPSGVHDFDVARSFEADIVTPGNPLQVHPFDATAGSRVSIEWERGRVIVGRVV